MPRGPAQPLAPGGGGHVTADARYVHRQLPDALAGVEEEGDTGPAAGGTGFLHGIDQAPVGPDVGEGGQGHPAPVEGAGQRLEVDRAPAGAGHHLDGGAGQLAHLEQPEVVAVVGDPVGQQALAPADPAAQGEPPQGLGPCLGVRSGHHHVAVLGADEPGRRRAQGGQPLGHRSPPPRTRPVPTPAGGGSTMASTVAAVGRAAPALLRWTTVAHPGVGARSASTSMGAGHDLESTGGRPHAARRAVVAATPVGSGRCPAILRTAARASGRPRSAGAVRTLVRRRRRRGAQPRGHGGGHRRCGTADHRCGWCSSSPGGTDGFVFHTNYESRKGRELADNPHAALLFYWEPRGRQVRIEGTAERTGERRVRCLLRHPAPRGPDRGLVPPTRAEVDREPCGARRRGRARWTARFAGREVPRPPWWGGIRVTPDGLRVLAEPGGPPARPAPVRVRRPADGAWPDSSPERPSS